MRIINLIFLCFLKMQSEPHALECKIRESFENLGFEVVFNDERKLDFFNMLEKNFETKKTTNLFLHYLLSAIKTTQTSSFKCEIKINLNTISLLKNHEALQNDETSPSYDNFNHPFKDCARFITFSLKDNLQLQHPNFDSLTFYVYEGN